MFWLLTVLAAVAAAPGDAPAPGIDPPAAGCASCDARHRNIGRLRKALEAPPAAAAPRAPEETAPGP